MQTLQVTVSSSTSEQQLAVEWLEVEATNGCFVICYGHMDLVSLIKAHSQISFKTVGGVISVLKLGGAGFVSVSEGQMVKILIFDN